MSDQSHILPQQELHLKELGELGFSTFITIHSKQRINTHSNHLPVGQPSIRDLGDLERRAFFFEGEEVL